MPTLEDLQVPKRRNLQPIREALELLEVESLASAKYASSRFGIFIIEGEVRESAGDRHIAGTFLGSGRLPSAELHEVTAIEQLPDVTSDTAASDLAHGDVVRVHLRNQGHGDYIITGIALASTNRPGLTLASWFLDHPNVIGIERLATVGAHNIPVPAPLGEIEETAVEA